MNPSISSRILSRNVWKAATFRTLASSDGWHGTTILCVKKDGKICMMGDGMVSQGNMIVKPNAVKIRRIPDKADATSKVTPTLVGFAGATADAFTLLERLQGKLDEYPGQLQRAAVEVAKGWRTDKYLRRLEASLLVADAKGVYEMTGNGDVLGSHDGVAGVGSGSPFAIAAARALMDSDLSAEEVARKAMNVAADMCVYTNHQFLVEVIDAKEPTEEGES
ncbi:ATP-dependent HslUV protease, peptidase subunit HslV [Fistulifera solaris]|uniref:ATP-dependent HslUV protease, peptidase subunit HslV n=1 Tax=Fistulifera solaris TaxID=1519565 RepID=A0A1Z5JNR6_FISSO|nr:ATP-dependent HslUV protease, peptidase subunit HslV [Fistulifera solaris]|eukprot:GAX15421.1 ATP-dependent HslUV protease, peptidase subunit HslV [Fistulifera solaris]